VRREQEGGVSFGGGNYVPYGVRLTRLYEDDKELMGVEVL